MGTRGADGKLPLQWFDVPSRPIVSFAGVWRPADSGAVFAFLTTDPNPLVAPIYPKAMPVLLQGEDEERWLTAPFDQAILLAEPYPSQLMTAKRQSGEAAQLFAPPKQGILAIDSQGG